MCNCNNDEKYVTKEEYERLINEVIELKESYDKLATHYKDFIKQYNEEAVEEFHKCFLLHHILRTVFNNKLEIDSGQVKESVND